jgi:hypothetical protein
MKSVWRALCLLPILGLAACGGGEDDDDVFEQQKAAAAEPANQSAATANRMRAPYAYSRTGSATGVYGSLKAGESDYYYVELDFFDSGDHQVRLKSLSADLDLEVIDWTDLSRMSEASGTSDELVALSTRDVSFFGSGPDDVRVLMRVYGKTDTAEGDFTLEFWTFDD